MVRHDGCGRRGFRSLGGQLGIGGCMFFGEVGVLVAALHVPLSGNWML